MRERVIVVTFSVIHQAFLNMANFLP